MTKIDPLSMRRGVGLQDLYYNVQKYFTIAEGMKRLMNVEMSCVQKMMVPNGSKCPVFPTKISEP